MSDPHIDEAFVAVASATVDDLLRLRPETATTLGDHRFDDRLDDLSIGGLDEAARQLRVRRSELAAIDAVALDAEDRVDHAMLLGELDRQLFEIDELALVTWDPLAYNVGEALYPLVTREVVPLPARLQAIAARLDQIPERLELAGRQLDAPPLVHVETALAQHEGTVAMVRDEVERLLAGAPKLRAIVEPAQEAALRALDSYAETLHRLLDGPHRDPRIGAERFARRLRLTLHSSLTPEEVIERARRRLDEVDAELEAAARDYLGRSEETAAETIRAALDRVARSVPDDTTVVGVASDALATCTAAVRQLGLVEIPDVPMRIELMPVFRRGVAVAYCDPAGPLEQGGETSFAISPTPEDWPEERRRSFYREYNTAMLVNLTVHEAMPGHMLQLAHARRFNGSTLVRQVLWSGPFVEGWAVHAERIMAEAGVGGLPVRLQQLKMQLRTIINAVLDVSIHAAGMTEGEALALMMDRGHQEEGEARGKWRRACLTSSQLSTYFVGYSELAELFAALGPALDLNEILAHGSPPPTLLAALLRA